MSLKATLVFRAALLFTLAAGLSAGAAPPARTCPKGEGQVRGKCVKLCTTAGPVAPSEACECPAGFGKILLGSGAGQCERLRCPTGTTLDAAQECDCAAGYQKLPVGKGKVRCEAPRAAPKQAGL